MRTILALLLFVAPFTAAAADTKAPAAQNTDQKTSQKPEMTVEGPIAKVVEKKKEIYVQGEDKKHEFYFKPNTELTQAGQPAEFSVLKEGMKVRVTYVKVGKRTDPVKVEILQ